VKETDLYPPIKAFLEAQGFEVKGEVGDCDVLAVRGDEPPVVVELKRTFGLDVILQAVDRLAVSETVYVAVPGASSTLKRRRKQVRKLVRMLGLGLIVIEGEGERARVRSVLDPGEYRPRPAPARRARLLGEFRHRVGDPNAGGAHRRSGLMTVYRQRALAVAEHLREHGPRAPAQVARAVDEPRAREILYRDVYGWFERISRGVYGLSPRGERELDEWLSSRAP
jgi:hypothetical protein